LLYNQLITKFSGFDIVKAHLPLCHPRKITHTRRTTQNPHQLRMSLHLSTNHQPSSST
jgi:hypothetical protein